MSKPLTSGVPSFTRLYHRYKRDAKKRDLVFCLTKEQFQALTSKRCFYCGIEPLQTISMFRGDGNYIFNGIDRKDNAKGYEIDNCVPCCNICNRAKLNMEFEQYITYLSMLVAYRSEHVCRDTNIQPI